MASIGLTIPAIAVASIWLEGPLVLGLDATQMVLLAVTVVVTILTVVPGRATRLQGAVHLVLLAAFLFLAVNPNSTREPFRHSTREPSQDGKRASYAAF
jgi:Ca2+:H+ antiporter